MFSQKLFVNNSTGSAVAWQLELVDPIYMMSPEPSFRNVGSLVTESTGRGGHYPLAVSASCCGISVFPHVRSQSTFRSLISAVVPGAPSMRRAVSSRMPRAGDMPSRTGAILPSPPLLNPIRWSARRTESAQTSASGLRSNQTSDAPLRPNQR